MSKISKIKEDLETVFKIVDSVVVNPGVVIEREAVHTIHKSLRAIIHNVSEYGANEMSPDRYKGCMSAQKFVEALGCALDQIERAATDAVSKSSYATASRFYADAAQIESMRTNILSNGGDVEIYQAGN